MDSHGPTTLAPSVHTKSLRLMPRLDCPERGHNPVDAGHSSRPYTVRTRPRRIRQARTHALLPYADAAGLLPQAGSASASRRDFDSALVARSWCQRPDITVARGLSQPGRRANELCPPSYAPLILRPVWRYKNTTRPPCSTKDLSGMEVSHKHQWIDSLQVYHRAIVHPLTYTFSIPIHPLSRRGPMEP